MKLLWLRVSIIQASEYFPEQLRCTCRYLLANPELLDGYFQEDSVQGPVGQVVVQVHLHGFQSGNAACGRPGQEVTGEIGQDEPRVDGDQTIRTDDEESIQNSRPPCPL